MSHPINHRIDVLDRFAKSPSPKNPSFLGNGYRIEVDAAGKDIDHDVKAMAKVLCEPKTHIAGIKSDDEFNSPKLPISCAWIAEIRFRPGVTDNVSRSVEALLDYAGKRQGFAPALRVASGRIYALADRNDGDNLFNPLIESIEIIDFNDWLQQGFSAQIPMVALESKPKVISIDLDRDDDALRDLSKRGIADETDQGIEYRGPLGLGLDDMHVLRDYYRTLGRQITDIELETFAQSWSEHCKHRFFAASIDDIDAGLFGEYIKSATDEILMKKPGFCLSVFHDNAGGIAFGDHVLAFKVETHNSPSALDPYGGAMTGVLGVNRDCLGFGMGAEPLANVFGYCLPLRDDMRPLYRQSDGSNPLPSAIELADGVIEGIEEGGNHSGIPTIQGFLYEDDSFRGKPLVYCGTLGILPREVAGPQGQQSSVEKTAKPGDRIYVFGNHVGYDGIHGATFSSVELDDNSPATAVQIGDPITQKNLQDVLFKARDLGLYRAITDNGAGGLSSSIGEMAESSGGAEVWLDKVALKYPGLAPWEIWISESQERMLVAVPPENTDEFEALMAHYHVSAQHLGHFTDDGELRLCYDGETLGALSMEFLHQGAPKRHYHSAGQNADFGKRIQPEPDMRELLTLPNFQSRAAIFRRYDHEVQGKSLLKPLIGGVENFASALRPIWDQKRGVALSQAMMPYLTEADPFMSGYAAVDLAVRRLIAVGANPEKIAILDNFCWSKPDHPERLWQLRESARGLYQAAMEFQAPIISGKDSMYNDFRGYDAKGQGIEINALPSLLISAMGLMDDVYRTIGFDFKAQGDLLALYMPNAQLLARNAVDQARGDGATAPTAQISAAAEYQHFANLIADGVFSSTEALSMGGIGFAIMRGAMASGLGADVVLGENSTFAEYDRGFLVSLRPEMRNHLSEAFQIIGEVGGNRVQLGDDGIDLNDLRASYFSGAYAEQQGVQS